MGWALVFLLIFMGAGISAVEGEPGLLIGLVGFFGTFALLTLVYERNHKGDK